MWRNIGVTKGQMMGGRVLGKDEDSSEYGDSAKLDELMRQLTTPVERPSWWQAMREELHDALRGKWSADSDWYVSRQWEWFYRLKAAICLLLNRLPGDETLVYEHIVVTYTNGGHYADYTNGGTIYWFEALIVGHGVLSNWWVAYHSDSN